MLALDATMSRQPTWDLACSLQAQMFDAVDKSGNLQCPAGLFQGLRRMPCLQIRLADGCAPNR